MSAGIPLPPRRPSYVEVDEDLFSPPMAAPAAPDAAAKPAYVEVDEDLFAAPPSTLQRVNDALAPVNRNIEEVGKGIVPGAVQFGGTAIKGAAGVAKVGEVNASQFGPKQLAAFDRIDQGLPVAETEDPIGYQHMDPAQRAEARRQLQETITATPAPAPLKDSPLYQAGQAVEDYGKTVLPATPGYEDSPGRQLGEGLGSMAGGAVVGAVAGPVAGGALFTLSGVGEAVDKAVQAGATEDQILDTIKYGGVSGATDLVPVEMLLGRIPIPGGKLIKVPANRLGDAIRWLGKVGAQALTEGGQEGLQTLIQNFGAQQVYKPDQDLLEGTGGDALAGGGVGALAEAGLSMLPGRQHHGSRPTTQPAPAPGTVSTDEFLRQADQVSPVPQPAAPVDPAGAFAGAPARTVNGPLALPAPGTPLEASNPAPHAAPTLSPDESAYLLAMGESPESIAAMNPSERAAAVQEAIALKVQPLAPEQVAARMAPPVEAAPAQPAPPVEVANPAISAQTEPTAHPVPDLKALLDDPRPLAEIKAEQEAKIETKRVADVQAQTPARVAQIVQSLQTSPLTQDDVRGFEHLNGAEEIAQLGRQHVDQAQAIIEGGVTEAEQPKLEALLRTMERARNRIEQLKSEARLSYGTPSAPIQLTGPEDVHTNAHLTESPTPAQAESGRYQKRRLKWQGLGIHIETEKGSERSGVDPDGKPWSVTMPAPYGGIDRSKGADKDPLDVYVGPQPKSPAVFVIDQIDPATGKFDETKSVIGVSSPEEAQAIYNAAFSDGRGPERMGAITPMTVAQFKSWVKNGNHKKPVAYKPAKTAGKAKRQPKTLLEHLSAIGGLAPSDELRARDLHSTFVPGFGRLVRKGGVHADKAREHATELGYLRQGQTIDDLMNLMVGEAHRKVKAQTMRQEVEGAPVKEQDPAEREGEIRSALLEEMDAVGISTKNVDETALARAMELVASGETDLGNAWEMAVTQTAAEASPAIANDFDAADILWESANDGRFDDQDVDPFADYERGADHPEAREPGNGSGQDPFEQAGDHGESVVGEPVAETADRSDQAREVAQAPEGEPAAAASVSEGKENTATTGSEPSSEDGADGKGSAERNAAPSKRGVNRVGPDSNFLRDTLKSAAFRERGFYGLEVPTQRAVLASVFAEAQNPQVLNTVISTIPVDVVNVLSGGKLSAKELFHDKAVFLELLAANGVDLVSTNVDAASVLVSTVARASTVGPLLGDITRVSEDGGTAAGASESKHPSKIEQTPEGAQYIVPGAERIGDGELAQRKADEGLKAKAPQKDTDGLALFGDGHKQTALDIDAPPAPKPGNQAASHETVAPKAKAKPTKTEFSSEVEAGTEPTLRLSDDEIKEVEAIIGKVAGETTVQTPDTIVIPTDSWGGAQWGRKTGEEARAAGSYTPGKNGPVGDVIQIALDLSGQMAKRTAYHESFHRLQTWFLSDQERAILQKASAKLRETIAKSPGRESQAATMSEREVEAEAFAIYMIRPTEGFPAQVKNVFARIARMIRKVQSWLTGKDYRTWKDVFDAAGKGEIAQREPSAKPNLGRTEFAASPTTAPFETPDTRSTHALAQMFAPSNWGQLTEASNWKDLVRAGKRYWQDKYVDLKTVQENIEKATGQPVPLSQNAYMMESLYHGVKGEKLEDFFEHDVKAVTQMARKAGVTPAEVDDYLIALHVEERNAQIASLYEDKSHPFVKALTDRTIEGGSGHSLEWADKIKAKAATGGKAAALNAIARKVRQITAADLAEREAAGLISSEAVQAMKDTYKHYVPLRGWELDDNESHPGGTGRGFDTRGAESNRALGRRTKADSPLAYVFVQRAQGIVRAEKNKVGKTFKRLVESNPNKNLWEIARTEKKPVLNSEGKVTERNQPPSRVADNVFIVKEGGKDVYITIHHPHLAAAMKNLDADTIGILVGSLNKVTRVLAALNTRWNIEWFVPNLIRDLQTAAIQISDDDQPGLRKAIAKNWVRAIGGAFDLERGKTTTTWGAIAKDFANNGGKVNFVDMKDVEWIKRAIVKEVTQSELRRFATEKPKAMWDFIDAVTSAAENAIRVATYKALIDRGVPKMKAASVARELTVNFNRKGNLSPVANAFFMFFNAAIQGHARLAQSIAKSPKTRLAVFAGLPLLGFLEALLGAAGDDDDKDEYKRLEAFIRERNLVIMWHSLGIGSKGQYSKIPIPYGFNVFKVLGTEIGRVMLHGTTPIEGAVSVMSSALSALNPLGGGITPTLFSPFMEIWGNQNYFGSQIKPNYPGDKRPRSEQYFPNVNPYIKEFTTWLNQATGGNPSREGWMSYSPEHIEHIITSYAGGLGRLVTNTTQTVSDLLTGKPVDPAKAPFLRQIYGDTTSEASTYRAFREALKQVEAAEYEVKGQSKAHNSEGVAEAKTRDPALWAAFGAIKGADKQLDALRKQERTIRSSAVPDAEKNKQLDALRTKQHEIQRKALEAWDKAHRKNAA